METGTITAACHRSCAHGDKKELEAVVIPHTDRSAAGDMIGYFVDAWHGVGDPAVGAGWALSAQPVPVRVNNIHDRQTDFGAFQMRTGALVLADSADHRC
jgi:hypothetical protein